MMLVLYGALTVLLAWSVARAVDWYPAHLAHEEEAMLAAIAAQQAGDEASFAAWEATQGAPFGGGAWRRVVSRPRCLGLRPCSPILWGRWYWLGAPRV